MTEDLILTSVEQALIAACKRGELLDLRTGDRMQDDPANAAAWGPDRTVRAEVIRALVTGARKDWPVHEHGVQVVGVKIDGTLDFDHATLITPLVLMRSFLGSPLRLSHARTRTVGLSGTKLPGVVADGVKVDGGVFLREGFHATGEVRLLGAKISGILDCSDARFENERGDALNFDGAKIEGGVFLSGSFRATAEVRLLGAKIGVSLVCDGARFENGGGNALSFDGAKIEGGVSLSGDFHATGEVRLMDATIGGNLDCRDAWFGNESGGALSADRARIEGDVVLSGAFRAVGEVRLPGATIGGNLDCTGAWFENHGGRALGADSVRVEGALFYRDLAVPPDGTVDLTRARVGVLADDAGAWPGGDDNVYLDGFEYDMIGPGSPTGAGSRIEWLAGMPADSYRPQPYEQLAAVLERMGHDADARRIRIERQRLRRRSGGLRWHQRAWSWFLDVTIRYGWEPWRAVVGALAVLGLGSVIFWAAGRGDVMARLDSDSFVAFQPVIYSLDSFIPFVDLRQDRHWLPDTSVNWGWPVMVYLWVHIALGWVLSTLTALSFTGVVRQR